MDKVTRESNCSQPRLPNDAAVLARLERRLERLERLLSEGLGAYLKYRFPYGDGRTDRWGRRP